GRAIRAGPREQRAHRHRPRRGVLRGAADLRVGDGRGRALPAGLPRRAGAAAGQARPARRTDPAARVRLPQRLLASVPGGDRAGRPRARPLQPVRRRRPPRHADEHAVPRQRHRAADPRGARAAAGPLRRGTRTGRTLRRFPASRRPGRAAALPHPRQRRSGRSRRDRPGRLIVTHHPEPPMSPPDPVTAAESPQALSALNRWLGRLSAQDRVAWALDTLAGPDALSTSFGLQSAVSLHLMTRAKPDIPVILVDTGYLFPETYRYADQLVEQLGINLKVYR